MDIQQLLALAQTPVVQALVMSLLGMGGVYKKYQNTGRIRLREFPIRAFRQLVYVIRSSYFTRSRPRRLTHVDQPIDVVREKLIEAGFEDGWYLSYKYQGEDGNLRRPDGLRDGKNRQLHVRLWEVDGGTRLLSHREYSPLQHPKLHLQDADLEAADEDVVALLS